MFFIALFLGWMLIFTTSPSDVDAFLFIPFFIGISVLQLECTPFLLLSVSLSLSITSVLHSSVVLFTLFTIVCVEVPLLLSKNEFLFQNIFATLFFRERNGCNSLFHLQYFRVLV